MGPDDHLCACKQPYLQSFRLPFEPGLRQNYLPALPIGRVSSRLGCGLGMTCTETSSPTRRAAAAPASVAALTAATSPRTITVTYPEPMYSFPMRMTLAAFTMASAASIEA